MSVETGICACGELVLGLHYVRYVHTRYHTRTRCASVAREEKDDTIDVLRRENERLRSRLARVLRYAVQHRSGGFGEVREWRQLPVHLRTSGRLLTRHGAVWFGRSGARRGR